MGIRIRGDAKSLLIVTALVGGSLVAAACGDDNGGGQTVNNIFIEAGASSSSGGSSGTPTNDGGNTSSSGGSSGTPMPDAGPTQQAATPTMTPAGGTFTSPQSVTIGSTTPGATIHYTTDGTNPTTASVVYANPISIATTTTLRAIAVAPGFQNSPVKAETYTINIPPGTTQPVKFTPDSGEYNNPVAVGLETATLPSTICYTLDGSAPTCNAGTCTGTAATYSAGSPIPVDAPTGGGALKIRALACSAGKTNSDPTESTYTFRAAAPSVDEAPREIALGTVVTMQTATANAGANLVRINYNFTNVDPTCVLSDNVFNGQAGAHSIQRNTTFRAVACRPNYLPSSPVAVFPYTVKLNAPTVDTAGSVQNNDFAPSATANANAPTTNAPATFAAPTPGDPGTGKLCYRVGADPECNGNNCAASSSDSPIMLTGNSGNNIRVRACRAAYTTSNVDQATYTFTVANVAVTAAGNVIGGYESTSNATGANFWNNGPTVNFNLQTDTTGETIRYSWATGPTLPAPPDVTCNQACNGDANCTVCTPGGGGCATGELQPFTTLKAIGCKADYVSSPQRQVIYADPTNLVTMDPIDPPTGTYFDDVRVNLSSNPAQTLPHNVGGAGGVHICWVKGITNPPDPTCDTVTGLCTTVGGAGYEHGEYNPNDPVSNRPLVTQTGTTFKARACKAGVPTPSNVVTALYTLKVALPTFTPGGPVASYDQPISWSSTTPGATYRYNRSGAGAVAADPSCASGTQATGVPTFDEDCSNGPLGTADCAPNENFKVIGCKAGYLPSNIASQTFNAALPAPTLSPNGNPPPPNNPWYVNRQDVTINASFLSGFGVSGGKVCYTTNGGVPACNPDSSCGGTGNVQEITAATSITLGTDATTISAISCAVGYDPSAVTSATYNFRVDPYTISPTPGAKTGAVSIQFTNGQTNSVGPDTHICYTTNGANISDTCTATGIVCSPSLNAGEVWAPSALQNVGLSINELKSRACRSGFVPTAQRNDAYTFGPYSKAITIDGTDDFIGAENGFVVGNNAQNGIVTGNSFYVSWDAANIYVGYRGSALTNDADRFFQFYIRGAGTQFTESRDNLPGGGDEFGNGGGTFDPNMDVPGTNGVNWHFYFRTDNGTQGVREWTGSWGFPLAAPDYQVIQSGTLGSADAYIEYRISRASLGLTGAARLRIMGSIYDPTNTGDVRFPATAGGVRRFLDADMSSAQVPNFSGYLQTP